VGRVAQVLGASVMPAFRSAFAPAGASAHGGPKSDRYGMRQYEAAEWSLSDRQRTTAIARHISQVVNGFVDKSPSAVDRATGLMLLERDFKELAMLDAPPGAGLHGYWRLQDRLIRNAADGSVAYGRQDTVRGREIYQAVRRDTKALLSILNRALGTQYYI
jgi:hypothetical protein